MKNSGVGLSQWQGAPCLSLDHTDGGTDFGLSRSGHRAPSPGEAALQGERSPAMLIDDDYLAVLLAHFLVKPFPESSTDPGIGVSQSV